MRVRSAASPGSVPSTARGVFGGPGAALARRQMEVLLGARLRRPPAQAARDDGLGLRGDEDHRVSTHALESIESSPPITDETMLNHCFTFNPREGGGRLVASSGTLV